MNKILTQAERTELAKKYTEARKKWQPTLDKIKHEVACFEDGITNEAEYLNAIIFYTAARLDDIEREGR